MKKLFFVAAMAAMALSSCSKNEVDSSSITTMSDDAIGFSTFVGINTKGLVTNNSTETSPTTTEIKTSGFGVFGFYHSYTQATSDAAAKEAKFDDTASSGSSADFMYNQEVKWDKYDGTNYGWIYSPVKYWPNNTLDRLSFFAYAPYSASGIDITSNGTPSVTFTINSTPETMIDLVADMHYNVAKEGTGTTVPTSADGTVSFDLEHILTRADIAVCLGDDITSTTDSQDADASGNTNTYVYLTGLKLVGNNDTSESLYDITGTAQKSTGLRSTGVFKVTASTSTVSAADVTAGTYGTTAVADDYVVDYVLGAWDYTSTTLQATNYNLWTMVDEITTGSNIGTTGPLDNQGSATTVTGYEITGKFLVPQPLTTDATASSSYTRVFDANHYLFLVPQQSTEKTYLYIQYDVVTVDSNLALGYSSVTNYAIVELSGLTTFGVAYRYNITIGLSSVKVSADVDEGWKTSSEDFADIEVATVTGSTSITATDEAGLTAALTELNTRAATSTTLTTFNVDAATVTLTANQTITIDASNFKENDTITFEFAAETNIDTFTIVDSSGTYTIEEESYVSGTTVTFKVASVIV